MTPDLDPDTLARVEELSRQLAELAERKAAVEKRARELLAAEDVAAGVTYAREIFEAKQERLVLETEMEIARRQRNRLTLPQ
jgi:S-adenosylmethionine synthetase